MKVTVACTTSNDPEVHAQGCADVKRGLKSGKYLPYNTHDIEVDRAEDAAEWFWEDIIEEGVEQGTYPSYEAALEAAQGWTKFLPCVGPVFTEPIPSKGIQLYLRDSKLEPSTSKEMNEGRATMATSTRTRKSEPSVSEAVRAARKAYSACISELKTARDRQIAAAYAEYTVEHDRKRLNAQVRDARKSFTEASRAAADERDSTLAQVYARV